MGALRAIMRSIPLKTIGAISTTLAQGKPLVSISAGGGEAILMLGTLLFIMLGKTLASMLRAQAQLMSLQWSGSGNAIIALEGTEPCTHSATTQMLSPGLLECCFRGFAAGLMETRAPSPGLGSRGRSVIATMSPGEGGTVGARFPTTTCSLSTARSMTARQGFIAT